MAAIKFKLQALKVLMHAGKNKKHRFSCFRLVFLPSLSIFSIFFSVFKHFVHAKNVSIR